MTNPDWLPTIRRAAAIVTDTGGMTCHAAIVAREVGVPCIVGARTATSDLRDGTMVTVDGTHGKVHVAAQPLRSKRRRLTDRCATAGATEVDRNQDICQSRDAGFRGTRSRHRMSMGSACYVPSSCSPKHLRWTASPRSHGAR